MKPLPSIPVAILSSKRKKETLSRTVQSLIHAGFPEIYIHYDHEQSGVWPGYLKIAEKAIALFGTESPVLIVQDDIVVCRGLHQYIREKLAAKLTADVGWISLYLCEWTRKMLFDGQKERLLEHRGTEHLCGALAWIWNMEILGEMLTSQDLVRSGKLGVDIHIPKWLIDHNDRILVHQPSLVNHADDGCSTYGNNHETIFRQADTFIGEDTNILEYLKPKE